MRKIVSSLCLVLCTLFLGSPNFKSTGVISIEVINIKNNDGKVKLSVFKSEDGFPKDNGKAVRLLSEDIKDGKVKLELTGLQEGEYAIAILHDENDNNKMDFAFYGKPKEGFGFSNNPRLLVGPPKFSKAKFKHTANGSIVQIKTKYF